MLMDLKKLDVSGKELEVRLDGVRITANKNKVPADPRSADETSGVRLGSPAVTTRGFKEKEMKEVGELITMATFDFEAKRKEIVARVDALCRQYPIYDN